MENYTRREFLRKTGYVTAGLSLPVLDSEGHIEAETGESILRILERKKQNYRSRLRVLRIIETPRRLNGTETGCCSMGGFVYMDIPEHLLTRWNTRLSHFPF